jgi:transcriptional regulator with XRE-family HTH domain
MPKQPLFRQRDKDKTGSYPNRIRQLRMEKGLTQQELAFVVGYESLSTFARLEAGGKLPSLTTALKLEVALQRLVPDIFPELYDQIRTPVAQRRLAVFARKEARREGQKP